MQANSAIVHEPDIIVQTHAGIRQIHLAIEHNPEGIKQIHAAIIQTLAVNRRVQVVIKQVPVN